MFATKCGLTFPCENVRKDCKSFMAIMWTDKPFHGEEKPVTPPVGCDPKCLNKGRMKVLTQLGDDGLYYVKARQCRFTRISEEVEPMCHN